MRIVDLSQNLCVVQHINQTQTGYTKSGIEKNNNKISNE